MGAPHMKILFVDDEFLLLEGLHLALLPICQGWEMEFVESGPAALARMTQTAFALGLHRSGAGG